MSTKTTFKRIALVAVAALGAGVLSVAPSQAASTVQGATLTQGTSTLSVALGETATSNVAVKYTALTAFESVSVQAILTSYPTGGSATNVRLTTVDSTTNTNVRFDSVSAILDESNGGTTTAATVGAKAVGPVSATLKVSLTSTPVAGTYVVGLFTAGIDAANAKDAAAPTAPLYITFTVAAALATDATSTSFISNGAAIPALADSATVKGIKTSGTQAATILVTQNVAGVAATGASLESMTVIVSGSGTVKSGAAVDTDANAGRAITVKAGHYIGVYADGTSGTGTVTITGATSGRVYGVETVVFYDPKPASATVVVKKAYPAAGLTTTSAVYVTVKDAAGNIVDNATVDLLPLTTGTGDTTTACAYSSTYSTNVCSVKGVSTVKFGKVSYKALVTGADTDETEVMSAAFDVTFADVIATKVAITAPATAQVGEKIKVTVTATEKNGYPLADGDYESDGARGIFWNTTAASVPSYSSSSFKPFNTGETITTVSGVSYVELYVPATAGTITNVWTLAGTTTAMANAGSIDKTIAGTTVTLKIAVASEALEAANAATTAALAANDAVDALAATVAKLVANLKAQITALTKLIVKIQKKVGA